MLFAFILLIASISPLHAQEANDCQEAQTLLKELQLKIFALKGREGKALLALQIEFDHLEALRDLASVSEEERESHKAYLPASLSPETGEPMSEEEFNEKLKKRGKIATRLREVDQDIERIKSSEDYKNNILFRRYLISKFKNSCSQEISTGNLQAVCTMRPDLAGDTLSNLASDMLVTGALVGRMASLGKLNQICKQKRGQYPESICSEVREEYLEIKNSPEVVEREKVNEILNRPTDTIVYRDARGNVIGTYKKQDGFRPWLIAGAQRLASFGQFWQQIDAQNKQMEIMDIQINGELMWMHCPESNPHWCNQYHQNTWDTYVDVREKFYFAAMDYRRAIFENSAPMQAPPGYDF